MITNRVNSGPLQAHAHKYMNVYRTVSWEKVMYFFWEIGMTGYLSKEPALMHREQTDRIGGLHAVEES